MGKRFSKERTYADEALELLQTGSEAIFQNAPGLCRTIRSLVSAIDTLEREVPGVAMRDPRFDIVRANASTMIRLTEDNGVRIAIRDLLGIITTLEAEAQTVDEDPPQAAPPDPRDAPSLSTREAAAYLGLGVHALQKWRYAGTGPRYRIIGKKTIRYSIADLDAFTKIVEPKEKPG